MRHKHDPERFFGGSNNVLRVIFDGIDGTANFNRGLPLFCSAVALLIDDQVRVSAIYDPIHHLVYSAALSGPYEAPTSTATASAWPVASGSRIDLAAESASQSPTPLEREAVGTHFTRSNPQALQDFLRPSPGQTEGRLERLIAASGGVYALNSGLVAMAEVARGALGAFVNVVTNPWDVAAGECLVRACGGIVTTVTGAPIDYGSPGKVSVLAAKRHLHDRLLQLLTD
jgi:myo-inositol-1(or 4)-monophosphatase